MENQKFIKQSKQQIHNKIKSMKLEEARRIMIRHLLKKFTIKDVAFRLDCSQTTVRRVSKMTLLIFITWSKEEMVHYMTKELPNILKGIIKIVNKKFKSIIMDDNKELTF